MHEQSLMNDLMNKINAIASQEQATQVLKVSVELGALAHMSPDHFKEHFESSSKGTLAEGAELIITENPDPYDKKAQDITLLSIEVNEP